MPEYELEWATRQIKRTFARAIQRSIPKILAELVTNADDSYRRLVQAARQKGLESPIPDPAPVLILFERDKRRFSVIDRAEGLTDEEMKDRFVPYGVESADRGRGFRTRSLFGKGLRDVLFTQHHGQVKSVKGDRFYNCRFRWKKVANQEKPVIDIKPPTRVTKDLRTALDIPADGTLVEFQLAENVANPQPKKLLEDLQRFYMLRMITSSPHREVVLKVVGRRGQPVLEEAVAYRFPELTNTVQWQDELRTDSQLQIHVEGDVGVAEKEMTQGEVGYVEREGGLLVLDEDDAVLDLHLFGFDDDPAARRILGTLRLAGAGEYIRAKLNQAEPEEVLTETRDGFDKNHPFYRALRELVQPRLAPMVADLRRMGPEPKGRLSDRVRERHQQALDILNRLASQLLGKTARVPVLPSTLRTPPADGIAFVAEHISVQTGVVTPAALLVNTALVEASDIITVKSDGPEIAVWPDTLRVSGDEGSGDVTVKIIRVRSETPGVSGKITATWKETRASMDVTTTEREVVTPINGLEFQRDEYAVRVAATRNMRLFVDLDKIPLGSEISVVSDSAAVKVLDNRAVLTEKALVTPRVGAVEIAVKGVQLTRDTMLTAMHSRYVAGARVSVVRKKEDPQGRQGLFKDIKFLPIDRKVQSLFLADGIILINTKDPVNLRYFGDEPSEAVEKNVHCQVRLADLILNECLWILVSQALEGGRLDRRFPDNPEMDVRTYSDEQKFEIGPEIHKLFVT
jgi:hypothetical protein